MEKMTIGKKMGLGFGILILMAMVLGGIAVYEMRIVSVDSTKLAVEYIPLANAAGGIRDAGNRNRYAMRGYGFTEKPEFYDEAWVALNSMDSAIAKGFEATKGDSKSNKASTRLLEMIRKNREDYRATMSDIKTTFERMNVKRDAFNAHATDYSKASKTFLDNQNDALKKELVDHQNIMDVVTGLVDIGTSSQSQIYKAIAYNDSAMLLSAIEMISSVKLLADQLRLLSMNESDL
ncbi:MAG: MCP four helix bundle domain-containing protein [Desulfobacterales bacterium]|jgi:methyl-accepting chemotaxis protein|nr:MCP four helix bundle domain-containing protein [Desulfobacterales bacterium]